MREYNETELFIGDKVQVDGGVLLIFAVGSKSAEGVFVGQTDKVGSVATPWPKNLILERGCVGEVPTSEPKPAKVKKLKHGMVALEPGDRMCHGGQVRTVISVTDKTALLGNLDGQEFTEERNVNEFLFTDCKTSAVYRLSEEERAAHLKNFINERKSPPAETENKPSDEKENEVMATKKAKAVKAATAVKVKVEKKPKAAKLESGDTTKQPKQPRGARADFILGLIKKQATGDEIWTATREKFTYSDRKTVDGLVEKLKAFANG